VSGDDSKSASALITSVNNSPVGPSIQNMPKPTTGCPNLFEKSFLTFFFDQNDPNLVTSPQPRNLNIIL
jgi:hypothetical protein